MDNNKMSEGDNMENLNKYGNIIRNIIQKIVVEESEAIRKAAVVMTDSISQGRLINVFGPGSHSQLFTLEMFFRAGGLAPIRAWVPPAITDIKSIYTVLFCEETPGFGTALLKEYPVGKGDVLIIANPNGINCCAIEVALGAKKKGLTVIGVSSPAFSNAVPVDFYARHPSKKNLHEVVDIVIDCKQPSGDAAIEMPGSVQKVAPVSGVAQMFIASTLVIAVTEECIARGIEPPIFRSGHILGGEEYNAKMIDELFQKF
ncbi:sugar isomerase domain-containing protein [Candidatus Atribacteria bacterium 1244-E10-H5-B2]|nr:MAG: sugar isomerase domain-containing protein [Candidatus Atribacteria bacterium 1244-E10-H5-B2]